MKIICEVRYNAINLKMYLNRQHSDCNVAALIYILSVIFASILGSPERPLPSGEIIFRYINKLNSSLFIHYSWKDNLATEGEDQFLFFDSLLVCEYLIQFQSRWKDSQILLTDFHDFLF